MNGRIESSCKGARWFRASWNCFAQSVELTHRNGVRMTHTFVVDVTQQDAFAEADYPTVVTLINSKQSTVRPLSLNDSGRADIAVLLTRHHSGVARVQRHHSSTPVTRYIERAHDTVRKNDKYYDQPLRTLGSLQPSDKSVSLCGVLVKVMDVRRCSSGDFSRMIFLFDGTTSPPFQITVFFKEEEQGAIFSVATSGSSHR